MEGNPLLGVGGRFPRLADFQGADGGPTNSARRDRLSGVERGGQEDDVRPMLFVQRLPDGPASTESEHRYCCPWTTGTTLWITGFS